MADVVYELKKRYWNDEDNQEETPTLIFIFGLCFGCVICKFVFIKSRRKPIIYINMIGLVGSILC